MAKKKTKRGRPRGPEMTGIRVRQVQRLVLNALCKTKESGAREPVNDVLQRVLDYYLAKHPKARKLAARAVKG